MKANIARFIVALRNGLQPVAQLPKVVRSIRPLLSAIFLLTLPLAGGAFLVLYLNGFFRWPDFSRIQDRQLVLWLFTVLLHGGLDRTRKEAPYGDRDRHSKRPEGQKAGDRRP
jgi:hypothetical protein